MGALTNLFRRSWTLERPDPTLIEALGGHQTAAGVRVNEMTALQASAVYACVRAISEDIAKFPLLLYRRLPDGGKERAVSHPLFDLLHRRPNDIQTSFSFRETMQACLLLYGNAYAYIDRNGAGRPVGLWFLHPSCVQPERVRLANGRYGLVFSVTLEGAGREIFPADYILHIPGLGFDGIKGVSVLRFARENLGTFLAAQEFSGRFFGNDTTPGLVLVAPRQLNDEERQTLHQQFKVRYEGASRKFRMAVIDQGWDIKQLGVNLEDAQFVQLMKFGIEEIARLFRVPPHKIGHLDRATYSNIEHQGIEYYTDALESWVTRWEQAMEAKLLMPNEWGEYAIEHLLDAKLRADTESRFRAYATGIQWGILTPNEVRAKENLNPMPGADVAWMPVNMLPVDKGEEQVEPEKEGTDSRRIEARSRPHGGPAMRARLARSYRSVFKDAASRIIRREVRDIRQALEKHLGERDSSTLAAWINQYYLDFPRVVETIMAPVYRSYAEAVVSAAGEEIGVEGNLTPDLEALTRDITASFAANHAARQRQLLRKRMREAPAADLRAEMEALLDELEETWPEKTAQREPIRFGGAIARAFFFGAGISALVWMTTGSNPCPLCQSLAGTVVGREGNFLQKGETVEVEGANPLQADHHIGHPPLHDGCECMIAPGG